MRFLFGRTVREAKRIRVHLASPMTPEACSDLGQYLVERVLDPITYDSHVVTSRIITDDGTRPVAGEIEITIVAHTPGDAYGRLIEVLESDGVARGSYLVCDGERLPIGVHDVALLHCPAGADPEAVTNAISPILDACESWVEDHYTDPHGPVLVLMCAQATPLLDSLAPFLGSRAELLGARIERFPAVAAGG